MMVEAAGIARKIWSEWAPIHSIQASADQNAAVSAHTDKSVEAKMNRLAPHFDALARKLGAITS
jgi:hypothetical protein